MGKSNYLEINMNWKAIIIGAIAYVILGTILNFSGIVGYDMILGALIAGLVASWYAKNRKISAGAITGMLAGLIGGIILAIISYTGLMVFGTLLGMGVLTEVILWGIILGLIGGAIASMIKK